ncbi:aromatic ring-hydroxylating oxygenase subunit alpha [Azospirillum cavernae]|nr:SRPBCC family protein [Azospirillum cavernae]
MKRHAVAGAAPGRPWTRRRRAVTLPVMHTPPSAPGFAPAKAVPGIPPAAYHDPAVFAVEEERIFRRCWVFAGFTDDLAKSGDWLTRRIGGLDVVVRNFDGELRAFRNVCAHRFAIIKREPRGNGLLRCGYHGWTYDRDGVPYGIPGNDAFFGLDKAGRCKRALTPVAVAACGRFLFLRIAAEGPTLEDWLGPYGEVLRHASDIFVRSFDEQEMVWNANWKMGVESVLEVYHADTVHPTTFRKLVKGDWRCDHAGAHSRGVTSVSDQSARWWDGVAKRLDFRPSERLRDYDHLHIFPNLEIGFTRGLVMSVQSYDPLDPARCALRLRLFLADPGGLDGGGKGGSAARRVIEDTARDLNVALLREDQEESEQAFRGVRQTDAPALLGLNEERIQQFHAVWRDAVGR